MLGGEDDLLDFMLLFFTSFLKFLLILPLFKCLFFSSLFHCYIKYVLSNFFYKKYLNFLSSFLLKSHSSVKLPSRSQSAPYSSVFRAPVPASTTDCAREQGVGGRWRSVSSPTWVSLMAFVLPHPSVWPTTGLRHLVTGGGYRALLAPRKAPHAFPGPPPSTRAPEGVMPPQPPGHQRPGQAKACCPLICTGHLAPGWKNKLGIAPLGKWISLTGSNQAVSLLPAQLRLSLGFFLPLGNGACVSHLQTSSASCLRRGYSLLVPATCTHLGPDPEPPPQISG